MHELVGVEDLERVLIDAELQNLSCAGILLLNADQVSWADRLRCTRVLGPPAVAVHCLLVKGLAFDGAAGLHYTAQRVTADLILTLHLLQRDLDKLLGKK